MRPKQFQLYLKRDGGCVHCGEQEAVAPHHRANRGAGGSKKLDRPSNIVVLCSVMNGLIESDSTLAEMARGYGWKISKWEEPSEVPVYYPAARAWFLLDDDFGVEQTTHDSEDVF